MFYKGYNIFPQKHLHDSYCNGHSFIFPLRNIIALNHIIRQIEEKENNILGNERYLVEWRKGLENFFMIKIFPT